MELPTDFLSLERGFVIINIFCIISTIKINLKLKKAKKKKKVFKMTRISKNQKKLLEQSYIAIFSLLIYLSVLTFPMN